MDYTSIVATVGGLLMVSIWSWIAVASRKSGRQEKSIEVLEAAATKPKNPGNPGHVDVIPECRELFNEILSKLGNVEGQLEVIVRYMNGGRK